MRREPVAEVGDRIDAITGEGYRHVTCPDGEPDERPTRFQGTTLEVTIFPNQEWPELIYVDPGGSFQAYLTRGSLDYSWLDWRQRAFIRAAATRVLAELDATEPGEVR